MNRMNSKERTSEDIQIILAITAGAPRSNRARSNLASFLRASDYADLQPQEMDLMEQPDKIIEWGVFASPALVCRDSSGDVSILYGDMSDTPALEDFLSGCLVS